MKKLYELLNKYDFMQNEFEGSSDNFREFGLLITALMKYLYQEEYDGAECGMMEQGTFVFYMMIRDLFEDGD